VGISIDNSLIADAKIQKNAKKQAFVRRILYFCSEYK
jgi:hypothetical protein